MTHTSIANEEYASWTSETTRISNFFGLVMGDHFHWGYFPDGTSSLARAQDALVDLLIGRAKVDKTSSVLDIGCGVGGTVRYLARTCKCSATGITNSFRGVEVATAESKKEGLDKLVEFRVADAPDCGLAANSFDAIIMIETTYLIPDKERLMKECFRTLKEGGSLFIVENVVTRALTPGELIVHFREIVALKKMFGSGKYESLDSYRMLATGAGFPSVSCIDLGKEVFPTIQHMIQITEDKRGDLIDYPIEVNDFLTAWKYTRRLCEEGISTYGLVHAVK
jgi:27-O-demethylrifamycin SV methyltransferase